MRKIILSVQDGVNLTAQTPKYMETVDMRLVGVSSSSFTVDFVLDLGDPSTVTLIHFYLSFATPSIISSIKELNRKGYVTMFSLTANTPNTSNSFLYQLGIVNSVEKWGPNFPLSFYTKDNTFFNISGYTTGGSTITYKKEVSGRNFGASIEPSTLKIPITTIATVSSSDPSIYFGIVEPGTQLDSFITLAPILFTGFLYAAEDHTENIFNILNDIYTYSNLNSRPPYYVEGFVSTNTRVPLERYISVHNQSNGALINIGTSDSLGYYKIGLPNSSSVFIVCHPENSNKRGLIHTYVTPAENERD